MNQHVKYVYIMMLGSSYIHSIKKVPTQDPTVVTRYRIEESTDEYEYTTYITLYSTCIKYATDFEIYPKIPSILG